MRNLLALLLLAPCALLAQVPNYVPTDGLVAYWPLDGNGLDQSGGGHHLTETNVQSGHDRYGAAESTVVFNGEDSHLTLDAFNLNQTGSFTVGFWAQMEPSAFTEPQCLFYEGIDGEFHFANADPGVDFTQFHWAAKANSSAWYGPAAGPLNSGEWNHYVGTYDQGSLELFVNGVSVGPQQNACCSQAPTDQLVLGARRVTSFVEHPFAGALDEFALWNRVLTADEIQTLFFAENTPAIPDYVPTEGLIGWYPLDGDAQESSGNQEDGVLVNVSETHNRFGAAGSAVALLGDNAYVDLGLENQAMLGATDTLTLSFWALPDGDYGAPLTKYQNGSAGSSSWFIEYSESNGYRFWGNGTSGTPTPQEWPTLCPNSPEGWSHVVVVFQGGTGQLWMNGDSLCATSFPVSSNAGQNLPVLLGRSECSNGTICNAFTGSLDDLGMWDRALTSEEIAALFAADEAPLPDYLPADGLLAWYPFNGNADDESGNGLDGTVDGAALTEDRTGMASSAYAFDGTDRIPTAGSPFNGQTALTFSAWIQSDNPAPYSVLMSEWPAGGATFKLDHSVTDEFLRFDLITSDGYHSASIDFTASQWAEWSHFIAVYDGSAIRLYLDGEAIGAPVPASGSISATAGEMLIGDEANNSAPFQGRLDDIALWGRALTAAEIEAVYEANLGCTDPTACNYDPTATQDDGSCVLADNVTPTLVTSPTSSEFSILSDLPDGTQLEWNIDELLIEGADIQAAISAHFGQLTTQYAPQERHGYQFDGDDNIIIETSEYQGGDFSIDLRAHIPQSDGNAQFLFKSQKPNLIIGTGPCNCTSPNIPNPDINGLMFLLRRPGGGWNGIDIPIPDDASTHRYTFTYEASSGSMEIYLDSELSASASFGSDFLTATGQSHVIGSNHWNIEFWQGTLDYVQFIGERIDAQTLEDNSICPPLPVTGNTLGFWSFDSDSAGLALDLSEHAHHGIIQGATLIDELANPACFSCAFTDTLTLGVVEVDSGFETPPCGAGTVWDSVAQECIVAIPTDTDFDGCVSAADVLNLLATFGTCPPIPFSGPCQGLDHVTYHGHDYSTVQIGDQCWFAENLQSEAYQNGDPIPGELNGTEWQTAQGAQSIYEELSLSEVLTGRLYNLHAVIDPRNLCPAGWHVPSLAEFNALLDPAEVAELKSTSGWTGEENSGTSGFNALPGGRRDYWGNWYNAGTLGVWWTSTPETNGHASWRLEAGQSSASSQPNTLQNGFSVRCVKN